MTTGQPSTSFLLPTRIFHAAMQRRVSLDGYAAALAIPADALRALLTARADELQPEIVARLAAAHEHPTAPGLASLAEVADTEPFNGWLERQMEGASQVSIRARTQLDARLLRAFISGKTLPDADQAERLARALYVDSSEMARVIVADMIRRSERPQVTVARGKRATAAADAQPPAALSSAAPDGPVPARARRRQRPLQATDTPATAVAPALPPPPPVPPASSGADRAGAGPVSGEAGPATPASARRLRAATRPSASAVVEVTPVPAPQPSRKRTPITDEAAQPDTPVPAPKPSRKRTPITDEAAQPDASVPAPQPSRKRTPITDEAAQADAPVPADEATQADTSVSAGDGTRHAATSRKDRRQRAASAPPSPASPDAPGGEEAAAPLSAAEPPRRPARARAATAVVAAGASVAAAQPDASGQREGILPSIVGEHIDAGDNTVGNGTGDSDASAETLAAGQTQVAAERPTRRSPTTTADVRREEVALQLSPDEVRLIRSYRRLHPHARRATLHYIGSLLVEE